MQTKIGESDDHNAMCAICTFLRPDMKRADPHTGKVPWVCTRSEKDVRGDTLAKRYCRFFIDDRKLSVEQSKMLNTMLKGVTV